jgi:pantoate--beta-alanine ligase
MKIFTEISEIRRFSRLAKMQKKSIGFVPTMGALHQGHLNLIRESISRDDVSICSIFVNPTQFNNPEDLEKYPRDLDSDTKLLEDANCDAVFLPSVKTMYQENRILNFSFGYLEEVMEGKYRPGHFQGVGLVVSKLFNIVEPDRAYFGEKDLQQLTLIKVLTRELNFAIDIVPVKTMREPDGLAMSSRNLLLSTEERMHASDLFKALTEAKNKLLAGKSVILVREFVTDYFKNHSPIDLEYFEIVGTENLKSIEDTKAEKDISLCIAGYLGKVRLIDNMSLN